MNGGGSSNYVAGPRFVQSEESGGVILTTENVGGGMNEDYDEDMIDVREGENDVEYIIMNLYSKMKNLENKYIDLANFYKQELVKTSRKSIEDDFGDKSGLSPVRSYDRSQEMD